MLPGKISIRSLAAAALLLAVLAMSPGQSFVSIPLIDAQEPAKPEGKDARVKALQQERLVTARELARQQLARFKNNQGLVEEVLESTRILAEAELDVCKTDQERRVVWEKILAAAKDNERIASALAQAGQGRESAALHAKAERLRIEIALERMKASKGAAVGPGQQNKGAAPKVSLQVGSIEAFESVRVFTRLTGFLKIQRVDIGARVKRGDVLAVLHVPELEAQVRLNRAVVDQARSRVAQAKARWSGAEADAESAKFAVGQAEANARGAAAQAKFRTLQVQRMQALFAANSIEVQVLDECKERQVAAVESENAAKAALAISKGQVTASLAKIEQAKADLLAAEAGVVVAQVSLEKSQELFAAATITAPFDGIVTRRNYFVGELIRSTSDTPLVTVQRIDLVRIVVFVPERDVPHIEVGNPVEIEIEALPGKKWSAKVARVGFAEDPKTRTMQVEIDLANPADQIRPGMRAKVSIALQKR